MGVMKKKLIEEEMELELELVDKSDDEVTFKVVEVDKEEADFNFLYQTLVGDSTDNYKGCPTVGAKKAEKLLLDKGATWNTVVDAYASQGLGEEVAIENARLARILRDGEYNFKTKEVTLWEA